MLNEADAEGFTYDGWHIRGSMIVGYVSRNGHVAPCVASLPFLERPDVLAQMLKNARACVRDLEEIHANKTRKL